MLFKMTFHNSFENAFLYIDVFNIYVLSEECWAKI